MSLSATKLIIGKFCAIGKGIEFVMNGANHRMNSVTTYPFNIMGGGWEKCTPAIEDLPIKGDTVVGNDVWIGQNVTVIPGIHIGDGAVIAADSVVTGDIPAYHIAGGNPSSVIRKRFDDALIEHLLKLRWWDWDAEKISDNLEALCSGDPGKIMEIGPEEGRTSRIRWQEISLDDYENHMKLDSVMQLQTLDSMMKEQLNDYPVSSVMILGVAGGNGLRHVDGQDIEDIRRGYKSPVSGGNSGQIWVYGRDAGMSLHRLVRKLGRIASG